MQLGQKVLREQAIEKLGAMNESEKATPEFKAAKNSWKLKKILVLTQKQQKHY